MLSDGAPRNPCAARRCGGRQVLSRIGQLPLHAPPSGEPSAAHRLIRGELAGAEEGVSHRIGGVAPRGCGVLPGSEPRGSRPPKRRSPPPRAGVPEQSEPHAPARNRRSPPDSTGDRRRPRKRIIRFVRGPAGAGSSPSEWKPIRRWPANCRAAASKTRPSGGGSGGPGGRKEGLPRSPSDMPGQADRLQAA